MLEWGGDGADPDDFFPVFDFTILPAQTSRGFLKGSKIEPKPHAAGGDRQGLG